MKQFYINKLKKESNILYKFLDNNNLFYYLILIIKRNMYNMY